MKVLKIFLILIVINIALELDTLFVLFIISPTVGDIMAQILGCILTSLITFLITYLLLPWVGKAKFSFFVITGVIWFIIKISYTIFMPALMYHQSVVYFFKQYMLGITGILWFITVLVILISPIAVAINRKLISEDNGNKPIK